MSITSGGMGKNELSMKETTPSAHGARGLPAMPIIQSYMRRIMWGAYSAAGGKTCERGGCAAAVREAHGEAQDDLVENEAAVAGSADALRPGPANDRFNEALLCQRRNGGRRRPYARHALEARRDRRLRRAAAP